MAQSEEKRRREGCEPVGRCVACGKARFFSRKQARRFARRVLPGEQFSIYECTGFWHFGHLPSAVRTGRIGRPDLGPSS